MSLVLRIIPHHHSYQPGDQLTATLEVACRPGRNVSAASGVQLSSVWIECTGTERVDGSWVSPAYAADVPPVQRHGRRTVRQLFHVHSQPVLQHALLTPGFSQRFVFRMQLPEGLPPSFRGTAVRYSYSLEAHSRFTVAPIVMHQQRPSSSSATEAPQANGRAGATDAHRKVASRQGRAQQQQAVRVPLHLWPRREVLDRRGSHPGAGEEAPSPAPLAYNLPASDLAVELKPAQADEATGDAATPRASRLMHAASRPAMLGAAGSSPQCDRGSEAGGNLTARRPSAADMPAHGCAAEPLSLRSYALRMGEAPLVRVALHAPLEGPLQPGAPLAATLDFRAAREAASAGSAPRCTEVLVLLETEEAVAPAWQPPGRSGATIRKVWEEWTELVPDTVLTHFLLSVPLDAPPTCATPAVRLRWLLRFQFTAVPAEPAAAEGWSALRLRSAAPQPDTIEWVLPLTVRPPGSSA